MRLLDERTGMEDHRTLLSLLADRLGVTSHRDFLPLYNGTAAELAAATDDRRFRDERCDERRWRRWKAGEVGSVQGGASKILERIFKRTIAELLAPPQPSDERTAPPILIDESELLMTAHDASGRASDYAAHRLSPVALEQVQDDVTSLARTYSTLTPVAVYTEARRLHAKVSSYLDQTAVPTQMRDLHFAAGVTAALLSQVSFDLGSRTAAVELARASRMHAEVIGHGPLAAFCDCTLALIAYWEGYPERAIRSIERAQTVQLGGTGTIRRAAIAARAYAHVGDTERARQQLAIAAETSRDERDEIHDEIGGELGFPDQRRLLSAGTTLLCIGDAQGAADASGQALELVRTLPPAQQSPKVLGEAAADQALARLMLGDLDAAAESLRTVLEIPADQRVDGLVQRVSPVRLALNKPPFRGSVPARTMAQSLEVFAVESVPTLLGQPPALG